MGLLDLLKGKVSSGGKSAVGGDTSLECQKCHTKIDSGMDRCPKCGTHVSSMFRIKCPKCGQINEWEAKICVKCGLDFYAAKQQQTKTVYTCPICAYKADYYMLSCPACGTKFV